MLTPRTTLVRRVLTALDASPSRVPVLLGGCGSGRSTVLLQLRDRMGRTAAQYVDVERTATTPERFLRAVAGASPFPSIDGGVTGARAAFDAVLSFMTGVRSGSGESAVFLLDEFLELRTFESFPGLRRVLHELMEGLSSAGNRFVLSSRYTARALRLLRDRSARFEVIHVPAFSVEDTQDVLGPTLITGIAGITGAGGDGVDQEYVARAIHALADGRPSYVRAVTDELAATREHGGPGGSDAISALVALMAPNGRIANQCNFTYELRLHRARGYGALKAILDILAEDEGLTLTEISQRLARTPGSTKDYLSWLEDVDLVVARQKRYSYADPLLRVWVRLHCRVSPPTEDDVAREIHRFALPRLPQAGAPAPAAPAAPALAMVTAGAGPIEDDKKPWGIIEID
jgi:hypothetical protein